MGFLLRELGLLYSQQCILSQEIWTHVLDEIPSVYDLGKITI